MKTLLKLSILFSALIACASNNNESTTDKDPQDLLVKQVRIQTHLVDKTLPVCESCLPGSVGDQHLLASKKQVFRLEGAEELNLKNIHFDIPVVYNSSVRKWIHYFAKSRGREHFLRYGKRSGRYAPVLSKILSDEGMPRDLIYLAMAESGFQNHARSWAKAVGPWQFMPYTGKRFGLKVGFFLDERRDPLKATVAASNYLRKLHKDFDSWELAMAGYNAGEGKIGRAIKRYRTRDFWKLRKGRYLRSETKNYVPKIMALAIIGKNLSTFGFDELEFDRPLDFEEIAVSENTDLYNLATVLDTDFETLKKFNPELIRWQVPPTIGEYKVRVPVGKKELWTALEDKSVVKATDYKTYTLKGHSELKHVARKFKIPQGILSRINGIPAHQKLFPKTVVYLPFRANHPNKHSLYADLYERPRKSVVRRRTYSRWIRRGAKNGEKIDNPKEFYIVKKGDNLWDISRKTGVKINTIIRSNYKLVKRRMILPGDKLAIR